MNSLLMHYQTIGELILCLQYAFQTLSFAFQTSCINFRNTKFHCEVILSFFKSSTDKQVVSKVIIDSFFFCMVIRSVYATFSNNILAHTRKWRGGYKQRWRLVISRFHYSCQTGLFCIVQVLRGRLLNHFLFLFYVEKGKWFWLDFFFSI